MHAFFNGSRITALIFLLIGIVFLVEAFNFKPDFVDDSLKMGPMDYPIWLIYGWLFMSLLFFITAKTNPEKIDISKSKNALIKAVLVIGCYYFSFPWLGLFTSSFLFFQIFLIIEGYRNYKVGIPVALGSAFLFTFVFENLLKISMPRGILIFFD